MQETQIKNLTLTDFEADFSKLAPSFKKLSMGANLKLKTVREVRVASEEKLTNSI